MSCTIKNSYLLTSLIIILSIVSVSKADKFTLVIEPTFPVDQGKQVYEPLIQWLNKKTGHTFELIIDNNYYFYWRNVNGSRMPDFTFDAPHIAAFRVKKKNYIPIATTLEKLTYHLISLDEPIAGQTVEDFMVSKKVTMLPDPSLASVYYNKWFTNLFASPTKDVTVLSWQEAVEIVFDGSAQAAIVPNWVFEIYPNFSSLLESKEIPGSTFTASPNVPKNIVESFQEALLSLTGDEAAFDILVEINTEGFVKPSTDKYDELLKLTPNIF